MNDRPIFAGTLRSRNLTNLGSGCGSVGRVVASKSRGPQFEYSHWQTFILNIYCQQYWKDKNKEKEAENGPFFKKKKKRNWTNLTRHSLLPLRLIYITEFSACICSRWLCCSAEIEKFLSLHWCSPLRNPQTAAASVNEPLLKSWAWDSYWMRPTVPNPTQAFRLCKKCHE